MDPLADRDPFPHAPITAASRFHNGTPPILANNQTPEKVIVTCRLKPGYRVNAMSEPSNPLPTIMGNYRSFLIRLWRSHGGSSWHASVQCVQTGLTLHFADPHRLYAFLDAQVGGVYEQECCSTLADQQ